MENKLEMKAMRKRFSSIGWALLIYMLIMNAAVLLAGLILGVLAAVVLLFRNGISLSESHMAEITDIIAEQSGWGYLLTILVGLIILWFWKGKDFCRKEIWTRGEPMGFGDFMCQLCFLVTAQMAFSLLYPLMELLLNQFGISAIADLESATGSVTGLSMYLYVCLLAPIAEELLFRGLVLRTLLPYGKRFAILLSALLFGVFHGNVVQIPYAILAGLVFGYTATEHSIGWAMVMHMFNNLVLSDLVPRLDTLVGTEIFTGLMGLFILGCTIATVVIAIVRRHDIWAYVHANKVDNRAVRAFFTSGGILTFLILTEVLAAVSLLIQLIAI